VPNMCAQMTPRGAMTGKYRAVAEDTVSGRMPLPRDTGAIVLAVFDIDSGPTRLRTNKATGARPPIHHECRPGVSQEQGSLLRTPSIQFQIVEALRPP
jgi:hypothetical protein